jgi:Zn-dependent alcohol dehydrogenase
MKIKSAVLRAPNKPLSIEELELDPPKQREVLVKYAYTGFCHSDLSVMTGAVHMDLPMAIGHEAAGVVEDVGPGVTSVKKGDHVVATFMVPCGKCPQCLRGRGNICSGNMGAFVNGMLPEIHPGQRIWQCLYAHRYPQIGRSGSDWRSQAGQVDQ